MENTIHIQQIYYTPTTYTYYPYPIESILNSYYLTLSQTYYSNPKIQEINLISQQPNLSSPEMLNVDTNTNVYPVIEKENRKRMKGQDETLKKSKDENFQLELANKKQGSLYKKKNTESNIANQIIAFINTQRSYSILLKVFNMDQAKVKIFYKILAIIKKENKKYVNRKYLKRLIDFPEKSQFHRVYLRQKTTDISMLELRQCLRKVVFCFLREHCLMTLSTSLKIHKQTLREHYWRKRQIFTYLFKSDEDGEM